MKNILLTITIFLFTAMLTAAAIAAEPGKTETQLWELIKETRDVQELDVYLDTYPTGKYVKKVRAKKWTIVKSEQNIKQIEDFVSKHPRSIYLKDAEDTIWKLVKAQNKIPIVKEYLKKYPQSRYREAVSVCTSFAGYRPSWAGR